MSELPPLFAFLLPLAIIYLDFAMGSKNRDKTPSQFWDSVPQGKNYDL